MNKFDDDDIKYPDWIGQTLSSKNEYVFGRKERSRLTILKLFFRAPRTLDEPLAPKEAIFLDFLETITYIRDMEIIEMIKDDVYVVKLVGEFSLIKFAKNKSINAIKEDADTELKEIALEINDTYPIKKTYIVWTKPNGSSVLRTLSNLKRH